MLGLPPDQHAVALHGLLRQDCTVSRCLHASMHLLCLMYVGCSSEDAVQPQAADRLGLHAYSMQARCPGWS